MGIMEDRIKNEIFIDVPGLLDDMVKVVRCKDCIYAKKNEVDIDLGTVRCIRTHTYKTDDWFCADGQKQ